jgi:hypothetical protein
MEKSVSQSGKQQTEQTVKYRTVKLKKAVLLFSLHSINTGCVAKRKNFLYYRRSIDFFF